MLHLVSLDDIVGVIVGFNNLDSLADSGSARDSVVVEIGVAGGSLRGLRRSVDLNVSGADGEAESQYQAEG
ncbi:hypothetical protein IKZ80_06415 [bacterium]|nr:hypothetical protein [bacterium]